MPQILEKLTEHIPDAKKGFALYFSATPFPGFDIILDKIGKDMGGTWYEVHNGDLQGWLCPALFLYFDEAPDQLYLKAEEV